MLLRESLKTLCFLQIHVWPKAAKMEEHVGIEAIVGNVSANQPTSENIAKKVSAALLYSYTIFIWENVL